MEVSKEAHLKMREIRISKGITQTFIAKELGFSSPQAYANIEYGHAELKFDVALKVANLLGVSVYDFTDKKVKQNV